MINCSSILLGYMRSLNFPDRNPLTVYWPLIQIVFWVECLTGRLGLILENSEQIQKNSQLVSIKHRRTKSE